MNHSSIASNLKLKNDLLLRALNKQKTERSPVWIMRQAGRYLPEYRQLKSKVKSFTDLYKNPQLACEITMLPFKYFDLDAAIIFKDILTVLDFMNLGLKFVEGAGPVFENPVTELHSIDNFVIDNMEEQLSYVFESIQLTKKALANKVPLIGFAGSPWTLACYMLRSKIGDKNFTQARTMMHNNEHYMHLLLNKLSDIISQYLSLQISYGVNAIMIFDTWGGSLSPHNFTNFSLNYMQKIISYLKDMHPHIPITVFGRNFGPMLEQIVHSGCDCIGLDWTVDMQQAIFQVNNKVALQGNFDPSILYADDKIIYQEVHKLLSQVQNFNGHIFNLGHGILPDVDIAKVKVLISAVHDFFAMDLMKRK